VAGLKVFKREELNKVLLRWFSGSVREDRIQEF